MKIGALIVTTGLSRISGVAALLSEVGAISAGQRKQPDPEREAAYGCL